MDFIWDSSKYEPTLELADKYEEMGEWLCDYCGADQVYVGDGRIMCAEKDCENLFGKDDMVEHMTGSYWDHQYDYSDSEDLQVRIIDEWDSRLFNIIHHADIDRMTDELIDRYKESWKSTTTSSLMEELEMVYRSGVKGFDNMDYDDILREYEDYEE